MYVSNLYRIIGSFDGDRFYNLSLLVLLFKYGFIIVLMAGVAGDLPELKDDKGRGMSEDDIKKIGS